MGLQNATVQERAALRRSKRRSNSPEYNENERLRHIEQRLVQIEQRIKKIEDKIVKVAAVTKDRFGKQVIITTKK
tara:strand:+ start:4310 stop:4534 length:225 start_codon:yes stop_codon:yes gene_type:complete